MAQSRVEIIPSTTQSYQFALKNLSIGADSLRRPYHQRTEEIKTTIHWGQRKLLISEVEFFTLYWDPKLIPKPVCVYAGAAPGIHIPLLSEMFPAFTFHLYDPAKFEVIESEKVRIFTEYFTDEVAARYAGRKDIFFISDIRTSDYKGLQKKFLAKRGITEFESDGTPIGPRDLIKDALREAEVANEDQIWGDMGMQQNWILVMNPEHALLKFRLPYALDGKDRIVKYLRGIAYWQMWPGQTSTETRLKPIRNTQGVYELANWSILEYEQWCFYHNSIVREQTFYTNIFTGTNDPIDYPELLNNYDSMGEAFILKLYFNKFGITDLKKAWDQVKTLSRLITWQLNRYKTAEQGANSLSKMRLSPVKSTNRSARDAFRSKRSNKSNIGFQHTNVSINPSWRQNPSSPSWRQNPSSPSWRQGGAQPLTSVTMSTTVSTKTTTTTSTTATSTTASPRWKQIGVQPLTSVTMSTLAATKMTTTSTTATSTTAPLIAPEVQPVIISTATSLVSTTMGIRPTIPESLITNPPLIQPVIITRPVVGSITAQPIIPVSVAKPIILGPKSPIVQPTIPVNIVNPIVSNPEPVTESLLVVQPLITNVARPSIRSPKVSIPPTIQPTILGSVTQPSIPVNITQPIILGSTTTQPTIPVSTARPIMPGPRSPVRGPSLVQPLVMPVSVTPVSIPKSPAILPTNVARPILPGNIPRSPVTMPVTTPINVPRPSIQSGFPVILSSTNK